jgi:hypothetical protein
MYCQCHGEIEKAQDVGFRNLILINYRLGSDEPFPIASSRDEKVDCRESFDKSDAEDDVKSSLRQGSQRCARSIRCGGVNIP